MNLNLPVSGLNRVGKTLGKRLAILGIRTAKDLLFYFPFRYEDYSKIANIGDLKGGEQVSVKGKIELLANKRSFRKRKIITEAVVADSTGRLRVVWFGQPFIVKNLRVGDDVYLSGKIDAEMFGAAMISPTYERVTRSGETRNTARLVPIYSVTAGLTQKQLRFLVSQIIAEAKNIDEWLPREIIFLNKLLPLSEAIKQIHFPDNLANLKSAESRLKFDELFLLQLRAEVVRQSLKLSRAPQIMFQEDATKKFVSRLPFVLTDSQKKAAWEILKDLEKDSPMNRLLEGDVGSGKTVVAAIVLYNTVLNNLQGVMLAPTEILAFQHFESLVKLLKNTGIKIGLLTASQVLTNKKTVTKKSFAGAKKEMIDSIKKSKINITVGTHALLSEDVLFKKIGLVIVDEQHRFGVEQRRSIKEKSFERDTDPHFLSMTATPIPRSFALALYGDLDLSIIGEMPPGRKKIKTRLVEPHNREKAYNFIREQIKQGRQAFVICPLIENKEQGAAKSPTALRQARNKEQIDIGPVADERKTVMEEYDKLSKKIFPDLRIGFLHGKLKSKEKNETMKKFACKELDILVSTSVVEVGVDIPNASVMMIEGAERFGLAQLHQFRGRVGRSAHQSYCFLFTDTDGFKARERLNFFEKNTDGFKLAEYDLETRGPGEVYGKVQSGMMNFKLATMRDADIIKMARDSARGIDFSKHSLILERMKEWESAVHLE